MLTDSGWTHGLMMSQTDVSTCIQVSDFIVFYMNGRMLHAELLICKVLVVTDGILQNSGSKSMPGFEVI